MPFNGSGGFEPLAPPTYPAVDATTIRADYFNLIMDDVFQGLSACVTRDGQSPATANLSMGGYKLTNLGAATANGDALSWGMSQIALGLGTVSAPTYSFVGDLNTGWYSSAANVLDGAVDGTRMLSISTTGVGVGGAAEARFSIVNADNGAIWLRQSGANQSGFFHFRDSDGSAGGYINYDHSNNQMRFATADAYRQYINGSGEFGFNCVPVTGTLARFQNAGNNDVGVEFQRSSATAASIVSYDRVAGAFRALRMSGDQVIFAAAGSDRAQVDSVGFLVGATSRSGIGNGSDALAVSGNLGFLTQLNGQPGTNNSVELVNRSTNGGIDFYPNNTRSLRLLGAASGKVQFDSGAFTTTHSQAFTATPTFNANLSNVFEFSGALTANVTSCTINNPNNGQTIQIRVKQDGTGGRTFAAPSGAKIVGAIGATANQASILTLTYSAMDARWEGSWLAVPV